MWPNPSKRSVEVVLGTLGEVEAALSIMLVGASRILSENLEIHHLVTHLDNVLLIRREGVFKKCWRFLKHWSLSFQGAFTEAAWQVPS